MYDFDMPNRELRSLDAGLRYIYLREIVNQVENARVAMTLIDDWVTSEAELDREIESAIAAIEETNAAPAEAVRYRELSRQRLPHQYLWFAIHGFLTAAATVSRIVLEPKRPRNVMIEIDTGTLRDELSVDRTSPLASRQMRDHFEHLDDHIAAWAETTGTNAFGDQNLITNARALSETDRKIMFRSFDKANYDLMSLGDLACNLREMVMELNRVGERAQSLSKSPSGISIVGGQLDPSHFVKGIVSPNLLRDNRE